MELSGCLCRQSRNIKLLLYERLATKMSVWNTSHSIGAGLAIIFCGYVVSLNWGAWFDASSMLSQHSYRMADEKTRGSRTVPGTNFLYLWPAYFFLVVISMTPLRAFLPYFSTAEQSSLQIPHQR